MILSTDITADINKLTNKLTEGSRVELYLTPKPGLVDMLNNGSHTDLNLMKMTESVHIIERYMNRIADSLTDGQPLADQVRLGREAEAEMYAKLGTNTHRGYIFLSGLIAAAAYHSPKDIRGMIKLLALELFSDVRDSNSNGQKVREKHNAGGIAEECLKGLPSIFENSLPAFHKAYEKTGCFRTACFFALANLMQNVTDTTAIHRCGIEGLDIIKKDGKILEELIRSGLPFDDFLKKRNEQYVKLNLTMGGIADMLGITVALAL
jgi:triphosphoribosyl-dephospho-CoA synthase